jgi:hypothetical protein
MSSKPLATNYLLLDGAQIDDLVAQIYQLEESPSLHLLYQQTAYEALADVGPVLVVCVPHGELAQVFNRQWRASGWSPMLS